VTTRIERWLEDRDIAPDAALALAEAGACFRAGVFRASLLFSYLGFALILRDRIGRSPCPPGLREQLWVSIQEGVRDDDKWEKTVFDAIQRKDPAPVFIISDQVRRQVEFWKDRRNDCAHAKAGDVEHFHIETFWSFLVSQVPRLCVSGGPDSLVQRFLDHLDTAVTPPEAKPVSIAHDFADSTPVDAVYQLLSELEAAARGDDDAFFSDEHRFVELLALITTDLEPDQFDEMKRYLFDNTDFLVQLLASQPQLLGTLLDSPQRVRRTWVELLPVDASTLPVWGSLMRSGLIPDAEKTEFRAHLVSKWGGMSSVPEHELPTFEEEGVVPALRDMVIQANKGHYKKANTVSGLTCWFLKNGEDHSDDFFSAVLEALDGDKYYPWHLQRGLKALLASDDELKERFGQRLDSGRFQVPERVSEMMEALESEADGQ